jgi:NTP pyrophosphatase (non-canonical NTP hydrolase)
MKNYQELEMLVEKWAKDKGILEKATPMAQAQKTLEEVEELIEAIEKDDRDEIIDAINYLKSKKRKTKEDKDKIQMLEVILKSSRINTPV